LSEDDVKTVVARALPHEGSIRVLAYELVPHSQIRVGFLGSHLNLLVKLKRDENSEEETHQFFVKTIPEVSTQQAEFISKLGLFDRESDFYNKLVPQLQADYLSPSWCPKCLLANHNVIVLEDVRADSFNMRDDKVFDGAHLNAALRAQARLHASSIVAEARTSKLASDICPRACSEVIYVQSPQYDLILELIDKIAQRLNLDHANVEAGLRRGLTRLYDPDNPGRRVISHGDAWQNNCLFKHEQECILVDFQLVRYAPRMYDVAQLVYFSTARNVRKELEREAIEAYHDELCSVLDRNNLESQKPSLDLLLEEYEDARCTALLGAAVYYPIIFMTKEMLIKYESNPDEIYQKIFLRKTNDFVMELYDEHEEYAKKLNELTREIVEYFAKRQC